MQFEFIGTWKSNKNENVGSVIVNLPYYETTYFETTLTLINKKVSNSDKIIKMSGKYKKGVYSLIPAVPTLDDIYTVYLVKKDDRFVGSFSCINPFDHGTMNIGCTVTCLGCLREMANQLAHMDSSGCLYYDSE